MKVSWHDADDVVGAAVDLKRLAERLVAATEQPLPQGITENHFSLIAEFSFGLREDPSADRRGAHHAE